MVSEHTADEGVQTTVGTYLVRGYVVCCTLRPLHSPFWRMFFAHSPNLRELYRAADLF
jgi:hypothetical protein